MTKEKPQNLSPSLCEIPDPYQPFGLVPQEQEYPPFMLDFKMKNGRRHGCNYNYFLDVIYTPTQIIFRFHDTKIVVKGRNLQLIIEALIQYRLDYVQEWQPGMGTVPVSATCIDSITVELPKEIADLLAATEKESQEG